MVDIFNLLLSFFKSFASIFSAILAALGLMIPENPPENPVVISPVAVFSSYDNIRTVEGGCTDGRYVYQVLIDTDAPVGAVPSKIVKIDSSDWSTVAVSEELNIDHANDMTYDEANKLLVVCNNKPNYTTITFVDPATLKVTGIKTLGTKIYSIAYVGSDKCWYAGISNSADIVRFDDNFKETGVIDNPENLYTRQSLATDGTYLYSLYYNPNIVYRYSLTGEPQGHIVLPDTTNEAENIFFLGGKMYVGFNILGPAGGFVARIDNPDFSVEIPIPAPSVKAA